MLDCDKITKRTKDLMFNLIKETDRDGKERLLYLCENNKNEIISSNVCIGEICQVTAGATECPKNTRYAGKYHTHPPEKFAPERFSGAPSHTDILSAAANLKDEQSFCIGFSDKERDIIKCFDIKDEKLSRLGDDAQKLAQKGEIEKAKSMVHDMQTRLNELVYGPTAEITQLYGWRTDKPDILETRCILTKK